MQATTNPGGVGTESLATDLRGEFKRVRYLLTAIHGGAQWYVVPATNALLKGGGTMSGNIDMNSVAFLKNSPLSKYRNPVLQYSSGSVVNLETGLTGTSGQAAILFRDGDYRTDSTSGRINCNLAQNAVLSGSAQSGLRTGSQTANTWYSFYAVKVTDSSANFVVVADTTLPLQANYSTLNTNFGTNGWVYLGTLPNGDKNGSTNVILNFTMMGDMVVLRNTNNGNAQQCSGILIGTQSVAGATLTVNYAAGTNIATPQFPNQFGAALMTVAGNNAAVEILSVLDSAGNIRRAVIESPSSGANFTFQVVVPLLDGIQVTGSASNKHDIFLSGYWDGVLGGGSFALL